MARRWSLLIAPNLVTLPALVAIGCAETPKPLEPPPAPPASSSAPPPPAKPVVDLSDPPDAKPGIGPFVDNPRKDAKRAVPQAAEIVPFGKGVMAAFSLFENGRCSVKTKDGACNFVRFASWKDATRKDAFGFRRPATDADLVGWTAPKAWPATWGSYVGTKDGILGVRSSEGLFVDRIDESGNVTEVFGIAQTAPINDVMLLETADGYAALGMSVDAEGVPQLASMGIRREGTKHSVHHYTPLKISPDLGGSASSARYVRASGRRVMWGAYAAAPVLDDKGETTKDWALVWTEVQPPAKGTPAGIAPGLRGGKNGCGRSSRPLSDPSVLKKTHVTVYGPDGRQKADHAIQIEFPPDETPVHTVVPRADGFEIDGRAFDKNLRESKARPAGAPPADAVLAPPPLEGRKAQIANAAGYHQKDGEGLVIFSEGDNQLAQRFSARGEPVGDTVDIPNKLQLPGVGVEALEKAGDAWVALEASGDSVAVVTGPHAGREIAIPSERSWVLPRGPMWILHLDEKHVEVVRFTHLPKSYLVEIGVPDARGGALVSSVVDVVAGTATPWSLLPMWYAGEAVSPRLASVIDVQRANDGGLMIVGTDSAGAPEALHRQVDGAWKAPMKLGEESTGHSRVSAWLHVFGDDVVVLDGSQAVATWLNQGRTVPLQVRSHGESFGPIVPNTDVVLGAEPGAPYKLPKDIFALHRECPYQFATGPRRAVLVCLEAPESMVPGRRVGWRTVRY